MHKRRSHFRFSVINCGGAPWKWALSFSSSATNQMVGDMNDNEVINGFKPLMKVMDSS
jgi:hypothetical protein